MLSPPVWRESSPLSHTLGQGLLSYLPPGLLSPSHYRSPTVISPDQMWTTPPPTQMLSFSCSPLPVPAPLRDIQQPAPSGLALPSAPVHLIAALVTPQLEGLGRHYAVPCPCASVPYLLANHYPTGLPPLPLPSAPDLLVTTSSLLPSSSELEELPLQAHNAP